MFLASKLWRRRLMYAPRWPEFAVSWHLLWLRVAFMLGLALRPGCQCLGPCSSGSFSLASRFDARGILGQGWCSTHDQQHSPWFVRVDTQGLNIPPTHVLRVGYARRSEKGWYFCETQVSYPVLMALPLLPAYLRHACQAVSRIQGNSLWWYDSAQWQRLLHTTDYVHEGVRW